MINWKVYKYKLDAIRLKIDGIVSKIEPGTVQNFYIEKDYDNDFLPVFMMKILLGVPTYHEIIDAKDSASFIIDFKIVVDAGDDTIVEQANYILDEFVVLPVDNTPFNDSDYYMDQTESPSFGEGTTDLSEIQNSYTFILARKRDLFTTRGVVNDVLTSTNLTTAVAYLLTKCNCTNVLMSVMDNVTMYHELLLLPIPLINQLRYLSNYYGFYKQGSQIFFDFDRAYILRNNSMCTAYTDTEPVRVIFYVYEADTGSICGKGSFTDVINKSGYINTSIDQFNVEDLSTTSAQYAGTNSIIVNNSGNNVVATSENTSGGLQTFNVITTSTHNPYAEAENSYRLRELKSVVTINLMNTDLRLLTPNRKYQIVSTSSQAAMAVDKPYRLCSTVTAFIKDGEYFSNNTTVKLKISEG